jgi:hypothetical protein
MVSGAAPVDAFSCWIPAPTSRGAAGISTRPVGARATEGALERSPIRSEAAVG